MSQRKWQLYKTFSRKVLREYAFSWKFKLCFLVVIPLVLVFLNLKLPHNESHTPEYIFENVDKELLDSNFPGNINDKLLYFPDNNFTQNLMEEVRLRLQILYERIGGFNDEKELENAIDSTTNKNLFAVIFHKIPNGQENELKYTIRNRNLNLETDLVFRNNFNELNSRELDEYMTSGFLALHTTINNVYMEQQKINSPPIMFEHFPAQPSKITVNMSIPSFAALLVIICCLNAINTILIPMVDEKENGIRALLKIATRYFYFNEIARLVITFVFFVLFMVSVFGITHYYEMWGEVMFYFPFLLSIFFVLSLISYTMCLSLFFKTVEYCKIAGILFYLVPFFLFNILNKGWLISNLRYCSPSYMFFEGMELINMHVLTRRNIHLSFEHQIPQHHLDETNPLHLFIIYELLLLHTVIYFLIYLLLKNVESKESARKTLDKLMSKKWSHQVENSPEELGLQSDNSVIRLRSVSKNFYNWRNVKEAVKNVNLDVQNNEITVLLGHNGAGKTTLMSIIAGVLKASGGIVSVNNQTNAKEYEELIGYCPQRNVFIKQFNCLDHVKFFGELRGLSPSESARESEKVLNDVKLWPYANKYPNELSGGMKRRLCLAISVIGNTKVVIMDEPSSGLDPKTRRELWEILLKLKKNRAILLSTHFMEEADLLGDKVSIMEEGQIVCEGTPMELKKQYTSGYILKIVTNPDFKESETELLLGSEAPQFTLKSRINPTVSYNIPYTDEHKYSTLLKSLETKKNSLNIECVSITNPPLEDVFLRCSSKSNFDETDHSTLIPIDCGRSDTSDLGGSACCFRLFCLQVWGVIYKKAVHLKNEWKYFLFLALLPFIALVLSVSMINLSLTGVEQKSLVLDFNAQPENHTIVVALNRMANSDYQQGKIMELFREIAPKINFQFVIDTNLENYLLEANGQDLHNYNEKIVSGIEMNLDRSAAYILVFYSGNYYHGSVKSFNLVSNVMLKYSKSHRNSYIETLNQPLLRKIEKVNRNHVYIYENLMPLGIFFYIIFFSMESYNDNINQFKSLFPIASFNYWAVTYIFDLIVHLIVILVLTGVSIGSGFFVELFSEQTHVTMGLIFFMYAVPVIPLLYLLTKYIKSPENLYSIMSYLAVTGVVLSQLLSTSDEKIREYEIESMFLFILPDFAIRHAMSLTIFQTFIDSYDDVYSLSSYIIIMIFEGIVIMLILIFLSESLQIQSKFSNYKLCSRSVDCTDGGRSENNEVNEEREATRTLMRSESRSSTQDPKGYPVIVCDLKKKYDNKFVVNNLCFRVEKGECFGLLGVNGAGKTSTLQMMTLTTPVTDGAILLNRIDCKKDNESEYRRNFGYCPQIDALNASMTAYETLKYMSYIKGVTNVKYEVDRWLKKCDLWKYRNIPVSNYSGGTKRKLNTAIALLGSPPVIFLDEPTTGIDPGSRRKIWQCIQELKHEGKTIILTSHSLDECEQLCNRIGIMYKGDLHCLGVTQKLKNDYADGYTLIMKTTESLNNQRISEINSELKQLKFESFDPRKRDLEEELKELQNKEIENLEKEMKKQGLDWNEKEEHQGRILKYRINKKDIVWSEVFNVLSTLKREQSLVINDYSVNEVSLEDIFLQIAKKTDEDGK